MATTLDLRSTIPYDSSTDIGHTPPPKLKPLIALSPNLKIYTPFSPSFKDLKGIWNLQYSDNEPLALIRATTPADVSTVVRFCSTNDIPLTVRSGGHDLWGRSLIAGALILDIRELNSISLAADKRTVTVGGGVQTGPLVDFLDGEGLATSCTLAGVVGHVGWAFSGGFGPFSNSKGLGVDQIVAAKIVTANGEIRAADTELLWGIKGAGGAFGVVTEVMLKVYPLEKMLGGMVMFQFDEAQSIISGFQKLLEANGTPEPLTIGFHFSKRGGKCVLMIMFSWASTDFEEGKKWLAEVKALGTVLMDMVSETTIKNWSDQVAPNLPLPSHSISTSVFISEFTPEAVQIFTSAAERIPDGVQFGIGTFLVSGQSTKPHTDSSFRIREPFGFIHAVGPVSDPSRIEESREWTDGISSALKDAGLVKANYVGILPLDHDMEDCFDREQFERLKALKKKFDPGNIFKHVPVVL